jgi:hypothetical protein
LFQRGPASEQQARVRSLPHVRGGGSLQGEPPDSGGRRPPSAGVRRDASCHCGGPAVSDLSGRRSAGAELVDVIPHADITGLDPDNDIGTTKGIHVPGAFLRA